MIEDVADWVRYDFGVCKCPAPVFFGREYLDENAEPPRVVIIPSEKPDRYAPPISIQQSALLPVPQSIAQWQPGQNPRTIRTRVVFGEAHIWAAAPMQSDPNEQRKADQQALDALINQTCASLHRSGPGNNQFSGGIQVSSPNLLRRGFLYVLEFTVEVPVLDLPAFPPGLISMDSKTWPERPVDQFETTVQIDNPDVENPGVMGDQVFSVDGSEPTEEE